MKGGLGKAGCSFCSGLLESTALEPTGATLANTFFDPKQLVSMPSSLFRCRRFGPGPARGARILGHFYSKTQNATREHTDDSSFGGGALEQKALPRALMHNLKSCSIQCV